MDKASQRMATLAHIKGTFPDIPGSLFTGEMWTQGFEAVKNDFRFQNYRFIKVLKGDKGWRDEGNGPQDLNAADLAEARNSAHVNRVTNLVPLLRDKTFTLKSLGASKVEGRAAVGVQVLSVGHPDVMLYFDADTGLLLKSEYRAKEKGQDKEVPIALIYSDYREADLAAADERALKEAKVAVDGPALVAFLRGQVRAPVDWERLQGLIKQLANDSFEVRQKATEELVGLGTVALPFLRQAAQDEDPETVRRARSCLARIKEPTGPELVVPAAVRLLALRKPAGAAEALLALVPGTADEALKRDLYAALAVVVLRDGKPDPAVERALQDQNPARKAAAAAVLGRDGGAYARQPGRRLFVTGLKHPMKISYYKNGAREAELEVTSLEFFNKFDDSIFARPR